MRGEPGRQPEQEPAVSATSSRAGHQRSAPNASIRWAHPKGEAQTEGVVLHGADPPDQVADRDRRAGQAEGAARGRRELGGDQADGGVAEAEQRQPDAVRDAADRRRGRPPASRRW